VAEREYREAIVAAAREHGFAETARAAGITRQTARVIVRRQEAL
jgi:hypothetical protein